MLVVLVFYDFPHGEHIFFSRESGYYDSEFYLQIRGGGDNEIHFTLDGSEPTVEDPVFDSKNPIYIGDATEHANIYSARKDVSTGFLTDLIEQYSIAAPNYTVPEYNVDKCNVVRAALFDSAGSCLDSITGVYFVGFQDKQAYENIYTASIVTSPENLFDNELGIYVTGITFEQFQEDTLGKETDFSNITPFWWWWTSNYSGRGLDWEREAFVTIFDESQNIVLEEKCGIRIKGGGSRGYLPKSLSCYARDIYGGSNEFRTDIFGAGFFPHKFVFFSGGDDNFYNLRDYMVHAMEAELNFATMEFIPCALFLDGEYWGTYYITEDYTSSYINDHYHVDNDNVIVIKNGLIQEGSEEDYAKYFKMRSFMDNHDMGIEENYRRACEMIDMDSYIDYYAAQIYIARRGDWPVNNFALWRARDNDGSRYGDCRWRWMLFDVNLGGMNIDRVEHDTLQYVLENDSTFFSLYQNEEFRVKFAERILYIGSEIFALEKCEMFLDNYVETMKEPILNSNMRFHMDAKSDGFDQNVNNVYAFFQNRYDVVWNFLVDNMGEEWLFQNGIQK